MKRLGKLLTATAVVGALAVLPMSSANAFWGWGFPFFDGGGSFSFGMNFGGGLGGWGYPGYGWGGYPGYGWGGYPLYGYGYQPWGYSPYGYGLAYQPYLPTTAPVAAPATAEAQ